tara:strand:+ start:13745 stop:14842 length:1098 start_codon:yes stop_codon:yes gene_type:complete
MTNRNDKTHISDFLLPHRILRIVCHQLDADFVDLGIEFKPKVEPSLKGGVMVLPEEESLTRNMFAMVSIYVYYLKSIVGVSLPSESERQAVVNFALSVIRGLAYDFENESIDPIESNGDAIAMRLDQFPMVWGLLRNIICPAQRLEFSNMRIIAGHSGIADACIWVNEETEQGPRMTNNEGSFIFVNLDVQSSSVRSAFLLYEALHSMCDSEEDVPAVISDTFCNFYMKERMVDFVRMSFTNDQEAASFFAVLSILCANEDLEKIAFEVYQDSKDSMKRTAQMATNWWFLGLTEKMLEPARSEDWGVYETWKTITDDLWNRVENERRVRGLDEVPFEMLLRIQSDDMQVDEKSTLQGLLNEDRIW